MPIVAEYAILPKPDDVQRIDSRPAARKSDPGHIPIAINIPVAEVEKRAGELPTDKPVIFFCSAGGRSGEALDKARKARLEINVYFLDANVKWTAEGGYAISNN